MTGRLAGVLSLVALAAGCASGTLGEPPPMTGFFDPREETAFVTESDAHVDLFVEGGRYHIHLKDGSPAQTSRTVFGTAYPDIRFEASLVQVADVGGLAVQAVGCWDGSRGFLLGATSSGEIAILQVDDESAGVRRLLLSSRADEALHPVGEMNRLRIDCQRRDGGSTLVSGWVNGIAVATIEAPAGLEDFTAVGFWAASETGVLDLEVDDYSWAAERQEPPLAPVPGLAWARIADDEGVFDRSSISSVVAGGPGFVAGGVTAGPDGYAEAAVWVSSDGFTWERVQDEGALSGPGRVGIMSLAAGGPGLVAVGAEYRAQDDVDMAVWVSSDGYAWTRLPDDESVFGGPGNQEALSVVAGGPGLVAVGSDDSGGNQVAAVWVSVDGYTWTRTPHNEAVFDRFMPEIAAVTAGGPGLVGGGLGENGVIWVSADGYTWTRIDDPAVFGGEGSQDIRAVAAGGPGLVAAGWEFPLSDGTDDSRVAVWVSADGYAWSRLPNDEAVFGGPGGQRVDALAAGRGMLIAGGDEDLDDTDAALWVSTDGYTWARVPHQEEVFGGPGDQRITGIAVGESAIVAVGEDQAGGQVSGAIWVSPPPD